MPSKKQAKINKIKAKKAESTVNSKPSPIKKAIPSAKSTLKRNAPVADP